MIFFPGGRARAACSKALLHQIWHREQQGEGQKHRVGVSEPQSDREQIRGQAGAAGQQLP